MRVSMYVSSRLCCSRTTNFGRVYLGSRRKMCCKHVAKQITDLDGSKRCQHLQFNNERTTASQYASGEDDYNRHVSSIRVIALKRSPRTNAAAAASIPMANMTFPHLRQSAQHRIHSVVPPQTT
jgi:hypothetical protein